MVLIVPIWQRKARATKIVPIYKHLWQSADFLNRANIVTKNLAFGITPIRFTFKSKVSNNDDLNAMIDVETTETSLAILSLFRGAGLSPVSFPTINVQCLKRTKKK